MVAMGISASIRKWIMALLGLGLSAGLIITLVKGRGGGPPVQMEPMVGSSGEMVMTGIELVEIEHEQQKWTLKAAQARYLKDEQKTELKDVFLVLQMKDGEQVELHSQVGILYTNSKDMELVGQVQARVAQSYQLNSDYAYYDHMQQTVSSGSGVHVEGPELFLDGGRWQVGVKEQRAVVDGGVKARLIFTPRLMSNGAGKNKE